MYQAYIFDLDGTLLDTLDDLHSAVNAALVAYSLPIRTREEVRRFVGNGVKKLMERAVGVDNHPDQAAILAYFKEYYGEHCKDKTKPYEGVLELLKELRARGKKCAVASNKADFAVKKLAAEYFDGLLLAAVGENEAGGVKKKPAPDCIFSLLKKMSVDASEAVYIGDSEVDIQTAKNAGLPCISVTWGFKEKQFLLQNGADCLVDRPLEILKI